MSRCEVTGPDGRTGYRAEDSDADYARHVDASRRATAAGLALPAPLVAALTMPNINADAVTAGIREVGRAIHRVAAAMTRALGRLIPDMRTLRRLQRHAAKHPRTPGGNPGHHRRRAQRTAARRRKEARHAPPR